MDTPSISHITNEDYKVNKSSSNTKDLKNRQKKIFLVCI